MPDEALAHFREARRARPGGRGGVEASATTRGRERARRARGGSRARAEAASCRTAGTPTCPSSTRRTATIATRKASNKVIQWAAGAGAGAGRRLGRPRALDADADRRRRRRRARATTRAATSTSASASTGWARSSTASTLHGFRAYGATFLIFSDYMQPAIRLAALMGIPSIFVFTHDSIGLGEDGPTHQPIEQLASLRATPNVERRAPGGRERDGARVAPRAQADRPPDRDGALAPGAADRGTRPACPRDAIERGAYVLRESYKGAEPDVILIATGSEVHICNRGRGPARGGRHRRARGVGAVPGPVRRAGPALPRRGAAAGVPRARVGRGRRDLRLGPLGRRRRRSRSGMDRFGASAPAEGPLRALRLHRRERRSPSSGQEGGEGDERRMQRDVNERLAALTEAGTSVWLDQIRRSLIESASSSAWSTRTRCAA